MCGFKFQIWKSAAGRLRFFVWVVDLVGIDANMRDGERKSGTVAFFESDAQAPDQGELDLDSAAKAFVSRQILEIWFEVLVRERLTLAVVGGGNAIFNTMFGVVVNVSCES